MPAMGHLVQMAHQAGIGLAASLGYIQVPEAVLFQADFSGKPVDVGTEEADHLLFLSARAVYAIQLLQ